MEQKQVQAAADLFRSQYRNEPCAFFVSPGRCEFIGNHTDHQGGRVVAAAIDLAMTAAVCPNDEQMIRICSQGFDPISFSLSDPAFRPDEASTPTALARGVAAILSKKGYALSGFDAAVVSTIPSGGGFSSSAAFACLVATIFNHLCCSERLTPLEIAKTAQQAETEYFRKPCGLMDQLACVTGGFAAMDFSESGSPAVRRLQIDLAEEGLTLMAVNTGSDHADLTAEYAAIPAEMKRVAAFFGKERLADVSAGMFFASLSRLQTVLPPRAVTRALHYFEEDHRSGKMAAAIEQKDLPRILNLIHLSGDSSRRLLQNTRIKGMSAEEGLDFALEMSREFCPKGAYRVHGGGFAGSILALLPTDETKSYIRNMEQLFGEGCCRILTVSPLGARKL